MNHSTHPDLLSRRRELLGPTYGLFYDEPLHMVRAEGVWMYDASGHAFLDAYNNVPVVGHCHPRVVAALVKQAARLNTHTRYLADAPVELAERLLSTMPAEIGNMVFVCTGSEANDLAIRLSKFITGGTGFIITERAYHGTSESTSGMSPSSRIPLGRDVYAIAAPLGEDGPTQFANRVGECIARMQADGIKPAALLVDTIFSSDGVVSNPPGFLAEAVRTIHDAGGLFIADEVQPGFGRTGEYMWGFSRHGVVPDIVTMGKPMGNGHPIAAMAARPELMAAFSKHTRYFNTFGGNTVSCAVALAVLDVIEDERLIDNARRIGEYLKKGLISLAQRYPTIGEVRGSGLFAGVDIAQGREPNETSRHAATRIVNELRHAGVLIGSTGKNGNTLKIRPPLPFSRENADFLLLALERIIAVQR